MKKPALFILFVLALLSNEAVAQTQPQFGVRVGGNLAQLRGEDNAFGKDATDRKLGFTVGAYALFPITNHIGIQPELLYTQKGGSVDEAFLDDELEGTFKSDFNLNYLEVPVLVKYGFNTRSRVVPSVYAGPYMAYGINRSIGFEVSGEDGDLDFEIDADDAFERMDYGAVFGVDFDYRLRRNTATIGLRYNLGLANVFKDDAFLIEDEELGNLKARTQEISLVLGVRLF
jgi:hypothetical protein